MALLLLLLPVLLAGTAAGAGQGGRGSGERAGTVPAGAVPGKGNREAVRDLSRGGQQQGGEPAQDGRCRTAAGRGVPGGDRDCSGGACSGQRPVGNSRGSVGHRAPLTLLALRRAPLVSRRHGQLPGECHSKMLCQLLLGTFFFCACQGSLEAERKPVSNGVTLTSFVPVFPSLTVPSISICVQGITIQFVALMERPMETSVFSALLTGTHLILSFPFPDIPDN